MPRGPGSHRVSPSSAVEHEHAQVSHRRAELTFAVLAVLTGVCFAGAIAAIAIALGR